MSNHRIFIRLASCGIALLLAACNHKSGPPSGSTNTNHESLSASEKAQTTSAPKAVTLNHVPNPQAAPVQPASPPATPANPANDPAAMLGPLTQALRKFSAEKQRVPASFSEVVAAGYVRAMPSPPPGKKFSINPKRVEVILVNQ